MDQQIELMQELGYAVDHSTVQRWVVYYAPRIERAALRFFNKAIDSNGKPSLINIDKCALLLLLAGTGEGSRQNRLWYEEKRED